MNRFVYTLMACAFIFSSCVREEMEKSPLPEDKVYASIEGSSTKVQLNEYMKTVWTENDSIWVVTPDKAAFYRFDGKTGDREGSFSWVADETWGGEWDGHPSEYGFQGYNALYLSSENWGGIGCFADGRPYFFCMAPLVQKYLKGSYGSRSNVMYGTSEDGGKTYKFVNILAYLKISLTGSKKVRSITLTENTYADIAGSFYFALDNPCEVYPDQSRSSSVTLDCGEDGVLLSDIPTDFYFALRPVTMTNGFSIMVTFTDGSGFQQRTTKEIVLKRNVIQPLAPISTDGEIWNYASITYDIPSIRTPWVYGNTTTAGYMHMGDGNTFTFDLYSYNYEYGDGQESHTLVIQAKDADAVHLPSMDGVSAIDLSKF